MVGISAQSAPGCAPVEQNHSLLTLPSLGAVIESAHSSLLQPWKLPPKTSAQEVISMDNNPGEVIFRSERTQTWNSLRKAMFIQKLGVCDPPNLPLCRACHAATPSIFHTPPTSLFGACKYTLGGCMYESSPFLYILPRVAHRTVIPHLSAPWPPLISSFSQSPVVEWPRSLQTLHFLDPLRNPYATNQLLWMPLLFNVSSHGTWMGSVRARVASRNFAWCSLKHTHFVEVLHFQLPGFAHVPRV